MYFLDTATALASIREFWEALKGALPDVVTVQVENTGDVINDVNGELTGAWTEGTVAPTVGTAGEGFAGPAGILIRWGTEDIADGHHVRARTFVVPVGFNQYATDGTILDTTVAGFTVAAETFQAEQDASFVAWHRPRLARAATPTRKALSAHAGSHHLVTSASCADKVVVMRSRRD